MGSLKRAMLLVLVLSVSATAHAKKTYYWTPLDLKQGATLQYSYKAPVNGKLVPIVTTFDFTERSDNTWAVKCQTQFPAPATTIDTVKQPFFWALEQIKTGPTQKESDLPRNLFIDVTSASLMFFGISQEEATWKKGFTQTHPKFPGAKLTVTPKTCSVAGHNGQIMRMESKEGTAEGCISPDVPLALSMKRTSPQHGTVEFTLVKYTVKPKLERNAMFYRGEPKGFDDLVWGTPASKVKGIKKAGAPRADGTQVYVSKAGKGTHWKVQFDTIEYGFGKDGLAWARCTSASDRQWSTLKSELIYAYGSPTSEADGNTLIWSTDNITSIYATREKSKVTVDVRSVEAEYEATQDLWDLISK